MFTVHSVGSFNCRKQNLYFLVIKSDNNIRAFSMYIKIINFNLFTHCTCIAILASTMINIIILFKDDCQFSLYPFKAVYNNLIENVRST